LKRILEKKGEANLNQQNQVTLTPDLLNKIEVTFLIQPGVYEIYDTITKNSYSGETTCLFNRLNNHTQQLLKGTHDNLALKSALATNPTLDRFKFFVLDYGSKWADQQKRVKRQDDYIKVNRARCFNVSKSEPTLKQTQKIYLNVPIRVRGVRYQSQRQAAKALGIGRTTLKRYCNDLNNTDFNWIFEESAPWCYTPVFGQKGESPSVLFNNSKESIRAGFATSVQNIRRKIQRSEFGWKYAHVDNRGKPLRIPYLLKPGEISYKQWVKKKQKFKSLTRFFYSNKIA
jgi:hypothetical protein